MSTPAHLWLEDENGSPIVGSCLMPLAQELEMMYFLIEPLFSRAEAFKQSTSDEAIADIITKMIR